jgi:hypothetical protein
LSPKTWYGMPAYANADGKVVVFFQDAGKFSYRYSTLGFQRFDGHQGHGPRILCVTESYKFSVRGVRHSDLLRTSLTLLPEDKPESTPQR